MVFLSFGRCSIRNGENEIVIGRLSHAIDKDSIRSVDDGNFCGLVSLVEVGVLVEFGEFCWDWCVLLGLVCLVEIGRFFCVW